MEQLFDVLPVHDHIVICSNYTDKVVAQAILIVRLSMSRILLHDDNFIQYVSKLNTPCTIRFIVVQTPEEACKRLDGVAIRRYKLYPTDMRDKDLELYVRLLMKQNNTGETV